MLLVAVGEKKAKIAIYSISVHPDGTRLATGGLGALIYPMLFYTNVGAGFNW